MNRPLVVAITGASGALFAARLLQCLRLAERPVHVVLSPSGRAVLEQELGLPADRSLADPLPLCLDQLIAHPPAGQAPPLLEYVRREWSSWRIPANGLEASGGNAPLQLHPHDDFLAPIASGSYQTGGMVICPCSGSTLSAVAHGSGSNLIHRAADVHLKERRRLVLVVREAPYSVPYIENLLAAGRAGAVVLPAAPGWYHGVGSLARLVDFVVARVLDQLDVPHALIPRWGQEQDHG